MTAAEIPAYKYSAKNAFIGTRVFGKGINIGLRWIVCLPLSQHSIASISAANDVTQRILSVFVWPLFLHSANKFCLASLKFKQSVSSGQNLASSTWRLCRSGSLLQRRVFEASFWLHYSRAIVFSSTAFLALQQAYCASYFLSEGLRCVHTFQKLKKVESIDPAALQISRQLSHRKTSMHLQIADSVSCIAALSLTGLSLYFGAPAYPFLRLLMSTAGLAIKSARFCNSQ